MVLQVDLGEEGLYLGEIGFGMTKVWGKNLLCMKYNFLL